MAITGNVEFVKTGDDNSSLKERLARDNNVKDIEGKITDLDKTTTENETEATINKDLEDDFDNFVAKNETAIGNFFQDKTYETSGKQWIETNFRAFLDTPESKTHIYLEQLKNTEISQVILGTTIELNNLSDSIQLYFLKNDISTGGSGHTYAGEAGNVLTGDMPEGKTEKTKTSGAETKTETKTENKEENGYDGQQDYLSPYPDLSYAILTKEQKIENIYRDNRLAKVMEKVFDEEEGEELRRGTFRVDLGVEHGLAGIVVALREALANKDTTDKNNVHKKLYDTLIQKGILHQNGNGIDFEFSRKDLKELIKDGSLRYEREGGLDNEINKVAKILTRAQRKDLDTFASLLQSKSDMTMAVKEWNNAKEMTGNDVEHPEESSLITTDNVLSFLCDFNSDAQISAAYRRKNNKEQRNQGDVGTLFGQQVMWTIEQAIDVKNVELGSLKGEHLVIQNIIKNMQISDSRSLSNIHLQTMKDDPSKCTKENLAKLVNGDEAKGIAALPEMKILFLDAIKRINGGSQAVQPDLYTTLVGKDAESLIALYESKEAETELKNKLDKILAESEDPKIKEAISRGRLVRVRETLFTSIMHAIDNVEITTNDGTQTNILAAGVSKGREVDALKKELLEETIKNLILSGIHYNAEGGLILTIGYGREGQSKTYRTKRNRGARGGVILTDGKAEIIAVLSGGIAEQYNYKKVINADLSQVNSAKYLGLEGGVLAGIGLANKGIEAEAYAGINRQQDPEAGINQIDKQYRAVSEEIFDLTGASSNILSDKKSFTGYIMNRIDALASDDLYGRFVTSNREHLKNNLTFMVSYMEANTFFGTDGLFNKLSTTPGIDSTNMANTLVDILQSGNVEQRRHDVMTGLHGKLSLTKLSFGLTTNALTLKSGASGPSSGETPPAPGHTGVDGSPTGTAVEKGQDRFGIYGLYVGLRISTWRNMYVPNVAQYLFTQYEAGQGIGMESVNFADKNLDTYGKYLIALYHDKPQNRLSYEVRNNTLILKFEPQGSDLTLAKFLNIHATKQAQLTFSLQGNVLTIGDVGEIASYTISEGTGVRRLLCLGTKKLDEASRVTGDIGTPNIAPIRLKAAGNIPRTKEKITTDIISQMSSDGDNSKIESIKTETAAFFDTEGKLQTPPDCTVTFIPATIEKTSLTNGTLTITKTADKKFTLSLDTSTSADQLKISYLDQTRYMEDINNPDNREEKKEIVSLREIETIFTMPANVTDAFADSTEKTLSIFDNYQQTLYRKFMENIVDAGLDAFIDADNYDAAFTTLKSILATNNEYKKMSDLKSLMESTTLSPDEKIFIVDKFKTIFSYITYLSDGKNDGQNLAALIAGRKEVYTKMKGPDEMTEYPCSTDYRTTILENFKGESKLTRTPVENLIGFTAFYKLNGEGRKYAMTPIGGTKVLTGSNLEASMMHLEETDEKKTQEWFISNLEINKEHTTMVLEKFNLLLEKQGIKITAEQLPSLLKGESLSIDSGRKISIDISRVFYLLGECANESLGMKIEGIKIQELKQTNEYAAIGTPEKEYTGGLNLSVKNDSITSVVRTQEEKVGIRYGQEAKIPGKKSPPPGPGNPTIVDPEVPPPPPPTIIGG